MTSTEKMLLEITEGRQFVFVVMAYGSHFSVYRSIKEIVERETGRKCIRADDLSPGEDLLGTVHLLIDRADLVIAELSTERPNVYYEVGYAIGRNREILLLAHKSMEDTIPSDLRGRTFVSYDDSRDGSALLEQGLVKALRLKLGARIALLRDMLLPERPAPAYVIASPRYPSDRSRIPGQRKDRRTFGDNLGIRGLLEAFGAIAGEKSGVELVSGQYCPEEIIDQDVNLYFIASKKVNPSCGTMLQRVQEQYGCERWYLGNLPNRPGANDPDFSQARKEDPDEDYICRLYENTADGCRYQRGMCEEAADVKGVVHTVDYGVIVRAPHPAHDGRMVLILAGAHSLGTGAACLAATRSSKIADIKKLLEANGSLGDKRRAFWAFVRGESSPKDGLLDETGVTVERAEWYDA